MAGIHADTRGSRLPGGFLAELCGQPLIQRVFERTRAATLVDEVFVLTSVDASDDALVERLEALALPYRRGSAHDLRSRYLDLLQETRAQYVVRVAGNAPFVSPDRIDLCLGALRALAVDLVDDGATPEAGLPSALDICSARALRFSLASSDPRDAEHLGRFFFASRPGCLTRAEIEAEDLLLGSSARGADVHWVSTPAQLEVARRVWSAIDHEGDGSFPLARALRWIEAHGGTLGAQRERAHNHGW